MRLDRSKAGAFALVCSFIVWAACAWFGVAGQRTLIFAEGAEELYDFWMPRMCWEQGYATARSADYGLEPTQGSLREPDVAVGDRVKLSDWYQTPSGRRYITGRVDKVYPALAILPVAVFPATRFGGYAWTVAAALVFLLSCWVCARSSRARRARGWVFLIPLTMPFVFNIERGNPIWLAAAAVGIFLAWWNSETRWKRLTAAGCLAVAAVFKIAPAILGLLYVFDCFSASDGSGADRRTLRVHPLRHPSFGCACCAALCALVLFFIPFLFVKEGLAAIPIMIGNAAHHADFVLRTSDFGFVQLWRSVRVALGAPVGEPWLGMYVAARLSQLFGLLSIFLGAKRRDYLLLVAGLLLAAGNMYYYAALYLIPAFILQPPDRRRESILAFVILCPLQLVLCGHSANAVLCNFSTICLMGFHLLRPSWR